MKKVAIEFLSSLIQEDTPKCECDIVSFCIKAVRAYPEKVKQAKEGFVPPTLDEVQNYVSEKNYNLDVQKFYEYYTESKWRDSRGKAVKNWKLKLLVWDRPKTSYQNNKSKSKAWERNYDKGELNKLFVDISDVEL